MSKVENQLKDEFEEEQEETLDAETQQKLNNLNVDETMFSSQTKSKEHNSKSKKPKKNNRGVDFLDYAKNNGIDLKIQYEDVTAERPDYKDYSRKNNTEFINKSESNNRNNFNKKENFTNYGDNRQRNGGYNNQYSSQQDSNNYNYNSGRNNNFQYNQKMGNKNYSNQSYYHNKKNNNSNYHSNNGQNYNNYHHKRNQGNNNENYYTYRNTNNYNNKGQFAKPVNGNKYDSMNAQNYNYNPYMGSQAQGMNMPSNMNGMNMSEGQMPIQSPQAYFFCQQQISDYYRAQMMHFQKMQEQANAQQNSQNVNSNYINGNQQQNIPQEQAKDESLFEMLEQYFSEENLNSDYLIRSSLDSEGYLNSKHILNWNNMMSKGVTLDQIKDTFKDGNSKIVELKEFSDGSLGLRNKDWETIKEKLRPIELIYQQYMLMNGMYMMQQNYYYYAQQNAMNLNEANFSNSNQNEEGENQKAEL